MLLDLLQAILMLGLPMAGLSWLLFSRLFERGELDRQDGHKAISVRVRELRKSSTANAAGKNPIHDRWMWFGSGFYGLAALWTLVVIEVGEFIDLLWNLPRLGSLLENGLIATVIDFFIEQLSNLLAAFLWFSYWPADSVLVWVGVAWLGYWAGVEIGRRHKIDSLQDVVKLVSTLLPSRKQ